METLVLNLCGLWFWLTRKFRAARYREVAVSLSSARTYLCSDFVSRASTRDRGFLLPDQLEALAILDRHRALVSKTSRRFDSLSECCRFVSEELKEAPAAAHGRATFFLHSGGVAAVARHQPSMVAAHTSAETQMAVANVA